jgi:flagellar hook assembly protein FlgD
MVIGYALPKSGFAKIEVYNLGGQRVRLLVDGPAEAGSSSVRWDGRGEQGRFLPPGAYFIKLRAEDRIASKKVVLFH